MWYVRLLCVTIDCNELLCMPTQGLVSVVRAVVIRDDLAVVMKPH